MTNKVLITGGASGLGFALAKACLTQGDEVVICDINSSSGDNAVRALSAFGPVTFVRCDITQQTDVDALFAELTNQWGTLDVLINNAGNCLKLLSQ